MSRALALAALLAAPAAAEETKAAPACPAVEDAALKSGDKALTDKGVLVAVKSVHEGGKALVLYPKGGPAHQMDVDKLVKAVDGILGFKPGDADVLDTFTGQLVTVRLVFADCRARVTYARGGAGLVPLSRLRRKIG